jgi:hypothetical protein
MRCVPVGARRRSDLLDLRHLLLEQGVELGGVFLGQLVDRFLGALGG